MENDYMKRGYLLPEGCKDLIDVLKPQSFAPVSGELNIQDRMRVDELAAVLHQKPFRIIADLMEVGVFANVHQQIDFDTITQVARKYGYATKKVA